MRRRIQSHQEETGMAPYYEIRSLWEEAALFCGLMVCGEGLAV